MKTDKTTIDDLAKLLDLPSWETVDELNWELVANAGDSAYTESLGEWEDEDRAENARESAEHAAQDELYAQWYDGVEKAAETILGYHHLTLKPANKKQDKNRPYELWIVPQESWEKAASQLIETINGGNCTLYVSSVKDLANTARQAVLQNLWNVRFYPEVYGSHSAQSLYEGAWR